MKSKGLNYKQRVPTEDFDDDPEEMLLEDKTNDINANAWSAKNDFSFFNFNLHHLIRTISHRANSQIQL